MENSVIGLGFFFAGHAAPSFSSSCRASPHSGENGGIEMNENEKSKDFKLEELFPIIKHQGREFLCLPTKTEMEMEDGTVYHVNTFYGGSTEMGPLLDALTLEKIDRAG